MNFREKQVKNKDVQTLGIYNWFYFALYYSIFASTNLMITRPSPPEMEILRFDLSSNDSLTNSNFILGLVLTLVTHSLLCSSK